MAGFLKSAGELKEGRLPAAQPLNWLRSPLGDLVFRPWFDWLALRTVADWIFPLSRAWAAALAAGTDAARFQAETGIDLRPDVLGWMLQRCASRHRAYREAAAEWERCFFAPGGLCIERLVAVEMARRAAAQNIMAARRTFLPLRRRLNPVRWDVVPPQAAMERQKERLSGAAGAFPAPALPEIRASNRVASETSEQYWLRFRSPAGFLNDEAWAHVYEPPGGTARGTIIFLHGIAMETEFWPDIADPVNDLTRQGMRVLRPEGPWHGRRRPDGWYGGEPAIARGPQGFMELFEGWIAEVAILIGWARQKEEGPVVLGGVSLGGLTSQLAVSVCGGWPQEMRPDFLFLVAATGDLPAVAFEGSLARALGLPLHLRRKGWSREALAPFLPLMGPGAEPALPPERIIALLGESDDLIPYPGGRDLMARWKVPPENIFVTPQGHFSVWAGIDRNPAPLRRLLTLVEGWSGPGS